MRLIGWTVSAPACAARHPVGMKRLRTRPAYDAFPGVLQATLSGGRDSGFVRNEGVETVGSSNNSMGREVLPIPDRNASALTTYDAKDPDTVFPPIAPIRPPEGAPNVLIILHRRRRLRRVQRLRRPVQHADIRAARGRTGSSTPASTPRPCARRPGPPLLSGRNHHSVGMGGITEIATSAPGLQLGPAEGQGAAGRDAQAQRLLDRALREMPRGARSGRPARWARSTRWPSPGNGFEHFYGFIGGETNQYAPALYRDTVPVEPDRTPEEGYHLTEDMTDQAIEWVRQQKALMPDKPFFLYFAPGATHAPHHVPDRVVGQVQGRVRRRLGRPARADLRPPEGARA